MKGEEELQHNKRREAGRPAQATSQGSPERKRKRPTEERPDRRGGWGVALGGERGLPSARELSSAFRFFLPPSPPDSRCPPREGASLPGTHKTKEDKRGPRFLSQAPSLLGHTRQGGRRGKRAHRTSGGDPGNKGPWTVSAKEGTCLHLPLDPVPGKAIPTAL